MIVVPDHIVMASMLVSEAHVQELSSLNMAHWRAHWCLLSKGMVSDGRMARQVSCAYR